MKSIALTGHRILKRDFDFIQLEQRLIAFIEEGYTKFFCGMALGFDMTCAGLLLRLKRRYALQLVACLPCKNQEEKYGEYDKLLYHEYLQRFDRVECLEENFKKGCMFVRNRYMVDNCDLLFAYLYKKMGGTHYTVEYAKKREKTIEYF